MRMGVVLSAFLLAIVAIPSAAQAPARRKLTFFAYDASNTGVAQEVSTQVRWKVIRLARPINLSYVEEAVLAQKMPPVDDRLKFWRDSGSLVLAGGQLVKSKDGDELRNEVFLGDFQGGLPDSLFVNFLFDRAKFASTKDALSAVALYAIAMEQVQRGDRSSRTRDLLARAFTIIQDIERRGDDVKLLRESIEKRWKELR